MLLAITVVLSHLGDDDDDDEDDNLEKSKFVTSRTIAMFKIVYTHIKPFVISL